MRAIVAAPGTFVVWELRVIGSEVDRVKRDALPAPGGANGLLRLRQGGAVHVVSLLQMPATMPPPSNNSPRRRRGVYDLRGQNHVLHGRRIAAP